MAEGIEVRHSTRCAKSLDGVPESVRCTCKPGPRYRASIRTRDRRKIAKTFATQAEARQWRAAQLANGPAATVLGTTTLRDAADAFVRGMESGIVRNRSGRPYKPSVQRLYEGNLRLRVLPVLGGAKLRDITRRDCQRLVDEMLGAGIDPATIRSTMMPLRAIFRRAVEDSEVQASPCDRLRIPAAEGKRDRIASPEEAAALLAALPAGWVRAVYATAFYAGLRLGELRALRWGDVDLAAGVISVSRSWDDKAGAIAPKSAASVRRVPIVGRLRDELAAHRMASELPGPALMFGTGGAQTPFAVGGRSAIRLRAAKAWADEGLEPIGLHECRHTFASLLIAAGVNAKAISSYMGHSSIMVTFDIYGKLMPGNEDEAVGLIDAYLARADTAARLAALEGGSDA